MIKGTERRKSPRNEKCGDYFLAPHSKEAVPFVLRNISVTGACISSTAQLKINEIVELHICRAKDMSLKSLVVWGKNTEYGLSFLLDTPEEFSTISFIINNELR